MKGSLLVLGITLASGLASSGCHYHARGRATVRFRTPTYVAVQQTPPPMPVAVTVRPTPPANHAVWVHGHWHWHGRWTWRAGHWQVPPRTGYVWTPPVVVRVGTGYRYHPGYFRPPTARVATVYTQPSYTRVSVQPAHVVVRGRANVHVGTRGTAHPTGAPARPVPAQTSVVVRDQPTAPATPAAPARPAPMRAAGAVQTQPARIRQAATPTGTVTTQPAPVRVAPPPARAGGRVTTQPTPVRVAPAPVRAGGAVTARPAPVTPKPPAPVAAGGTVRARPAALGLSCTLNTARAPRGGFVTLRGQGFSSQAVVRIGGNIAAIVANTPTQLRVQVPQRSGGGVVSVSTGSRSTNCGQLAVIGR